jgi:hypothetical protein
MRKKLPWTTIQAIRACDAARSTYCIAREFNLSASSVWLILAGNIYKDRDYVPAKRKPRGKLNKTIAYTIRKEVANGTKAIELARRYGVSPTAVCLILQNKNYRDEGYVPPVRGTWQMAA